MRRGVFFSSLLIAGSALCAPAIAQAQNKPPEAVQAEALLAEAKMLTARAEAPVAQTAAPAAKPAKPAKPAPLLATPNGQVMDRAREIAEADLAAAPEEEIRPLRVDPNLARKRDFALPRQSPRPAAEEKPALAERAPETRPAIAAETKAVMAAAEPARAPAESEERQPALAEHGAESDSLRGGGDPVVRPTYAQRRYEADEADEADAEAGVGDPVVRPAYRQRRWEPRRVEQAARAPAAQPRTASEGRPDYAEAERIVREVNARAEDGPLPAAEAGRIAAAAPAAELPAAVEAPVVETAQAADAAPVARAARAADAAPLNETEQVADAAGAAEDVGDAGEVADAAGDGGREVLREAARAARVVRQAGRVARVLGGAAIGAAADAPVYAGDDREERREAPVYADDERETDRGYAGEEPVYAEDVREERREPPVYARERREPVYAEQRRAPVYSDERREPVYAGERPEAPVYAGDDRAWPPVYADERPLRPRFDRYGYGERFASRQVGSYCDGYRYDGLLRAVRRAVDVGSIDWRTARDMEAEIAHGEEMQRSYCASGLNGWRAQRLDAQYSQIEDRLRFERRRYR